MSSINKNLVNSINQHDTKGVNLNPKEQEHPLEGHLNVLCLLAISCVILFCQVLWLIGFSFFFCCFILTLWCCFYWTLFSFLHVHKHVSMSIWVWLVSLLCVLLLYKSLLKRWVWGPLWSKRKKTAQYEDLFLDMRPKAIGCSTVVQRPTNKKNKKKHGSPLLWYGFPKRIVFSFHTGDYRVQAPVTLSMKDILRKHTVQALLCGKNVNFSVFKWEKGGTGGWNNFGNLDRFHPSSSHSPPSFLFLSSSCLAFSNVFLVVCPIAYNSQHAWSAYFSVLENH